MLDDMQRVFLSVNSEMQILMVGTISLVCNALMYGNVGGEMLTVYTPFDNLDGVNLGSIELEHHHFHDDDYCERFTEGDNLWVPSAERALVDTIEFLDRYYIEGPLVESMQEYISRCDDLHKLYEVADHYGVDREKIDYWVKEAKDSQYMSWG